MDCQWGDIAAGVLAVLKFRYISESALRNVQNFSHIYTQRHWQTEEDCLERPSTTAFQPVKYER